MRILTDKEAEHACLAPAHVAEKVINEGLAKQVEDVVVLGEQLFERAYLPSDERASFYLRVGRIAS